MISLDGLHERLRVLAMLLDGAAQAIQEIPLAPPRENTRHIGTALAAVFDVMRAIHAVRPDLVPERLEESERTVLANTRLTRALADALALAEQGRPEAALELLSSYAAGESSQLHRRIALYERERRSDTGDT